MYRFEDYGLIIDARCEREYFEDHIPGAINLPVVRNDEYAEVGTLHRTDKMAAYLIGVSYSLKNISHHLDTVIAAYPRRGRILVYCFRGGKRSRLWFDALDTIGFKVDRLPGGWKGYRHWVNEQLESRPRAFTYHVLSGPTGCGKTRLLEQLAAEGAQVLDLEALAAHRGSVIGAIPGIGQPTQKYFDSLLLHKLSTFSTTRPVWVEAESKRIGNVQLPLALLETMHSTGTLLQVSAPMTERVRLWREDYGHFESDPDSLVRRLAHLRSLVGGKEFELWQGLARTRKIPELFERLMASHYDPSYARSTKRGYQRLDDAPAINLPDLQLDTLRATARTLIERFG
ncbi:Selenophosphate-dependent tRNA 2-selenouridine synthase [Burkholderia diffusa]|uniref:tRNA 2-selenouridine(34) synthase MnmH n=1 Tax=Burkholderia diffusa TaxID=488732 RepID=UPI001CABF594|nr:tRNA 2-selenouridine(34) synthase MnmH [Burkholderia diffusa]CAG9264427.1 Selenophosphate-dependent tRNA 2-selenouridine synthase [Burkholderia diffusa]